MMECHRVFTREVNSLTYLSARKGPPPPASEGHPPPATKGPNQTSPDPAGRQRHPHQPIQYSR